MHWVIHLFDRNVLGTLLGNGNTMEVGDTRRHQPCHYGAYSLVGKAENSQIITLKTNTLEKSLAPCWPFAGIRCINTSVFNAMKEKTGCGVQAGVNR